MEDILQIVKTETETLLAKAGLEGSVEVSNDENGINVSLTTSDTALVIGKHGNTLSSFEYILAQLVAAKTGEYARIIVEVGGYRQEREAYLHDLTTRLKEEVIATGAEKTIRGLKPWERRLVHMQLAEDSEVITESMGEERERVLVIKKK